MRWWFWTVLAFACAIIPCGIIPELTERARRDDLLGLPFPWGSTVVCLLFAVPAGFAWALRFRPDWIPGPTAEEQANQRAAKLREVEGWLRNRVSAREAREMVKHAPEFDEWLESNHQGDVDELWYYSTDAVSWENLAGENGFAILHNGTTRGVLYVGNELRSRDDFAGDWSMRYALAAVATLLLSVGVRLYSDYALWTKMQLARMDVRPSAMQRLMILIVIVAAIFFFAVYVAPRSERSGPAR